MGKQNMPLFWRQLTLSLVGTVIYCIAINMFVVPAGLYSSGLLGLCQVLRTVLERYLHLSFGTFDISGLIYYIINVPILLMAWTRLSKPLVVRTLIVVSASVVLLTVIPVVPLLPSDTLTNCLLGGALAGAGVGLVLRGSTTMGGIDATALMVIQKNKNFSVGNLNLALNMVVYVSSMMLFDIPTGIYSIASALVYSVAIDHVHSQNIDVEVTIITKADVEPMQEKIFRTLERGATQLQGVGAYTKEGVSVLMVALSEYEVATLRHIVHDVDPHAFVIAKDHVKIFGNYDKKL